MLGQAGGGQVAFQVASPLLKLIVLLLQLAAHGAQPELSLDTCAQDCRIDRFGYEVVRPGFEAKHLAFFAAVAGQHDRGNLGDRRIVVRSQPLEDLGPIERRHIEIEQEKRGLLVLH